MFDRHAMPILPILLACALSACTQAAAKTGDGGQAGAQSAPEQVSADVVVDHALHAGKYRIPCLFCHDHADDSVVAGVPSLELCMGCHKYVDKKKPAVKALARDAKEGTAPTWPRLYTLPDFVYFSHRMHVTNGVRCQECHGDVQDMHTVRRVAPLTMGWCVDCHRERGASEDCVTCHK